MTCYHPMVAFRVKSGRKPDGSWPLSFNSIDGDTAYPVDIPCGKCIGCRLQASKKWAIRCVHEAQMHKDNCWLTLTYDNKHNEPSLNKRDFQLFMKSLRFKTNKKMRYFMCGEYGELSERRHYHCCLFGYAFDDKYLWSQSNGGDLYRSELLESVWKNGNSAIADLTVESAAYTAGYCMKKVKGAQAYHYYKSRNIIPEFTLMSRDPGIGSKWWDKYSNDVIQTDMVVLNNGLTMGVPRYYYSKCESSLVAQIKSERKEVKYTVDELKRMEVNCMAKYKFKKRSYENGNHSSF